MFSRPFASEQASQSAASQPNALNDRATEPQTRTAEAASNHDLMLEVIRIRRWQHVINEQLKEKRFKIPIHLAMGNEAVAVAVSDGMNDHDQLVLPHRNISYNLARAESFTLVHQEYLADSGGAGRGVLGSMNLAQPGRGVVYASSILGNNLPIASGLALANNVLQRNALVTVVTGDGAMEEGTFYEGLVFAKSHGLAVLFLVENNNQSMSSTIAERRCPIMLADLCRAVEVPYCSLSSNDVVEYAATFCELRRLALQQNTPICIEAAVRAFCQHAGPTPGWPTDPKRIDFSAGLLVEASPDDPLFVIRQQLGAAYFNSVCNEICAAA